MGKKQKCKFKWKIRHETEMEAKLHLLRLKSRDQEIYKCGDHYHIGNGRVKRRAYENRRRSVKR